MHVVIIGERVDTVDYTVGIALQYHAYRDPICSKAIASAFYSLTIYTVFTTRVLAYCTVQTQRKFSLMEETIEL